MACGSCGLLSFGKRRKRAAKKVKDEDEVHVVKHRKSRRGSKRSRRGSKRSRRGSKRSRKMRRRISRRRFGMVAGPGYKGQTSYSNAFAPYFGAAEPFVSASQWWYPYAGGVAQSPQMLMKSAGKMMGPGN